MWGYVSSDVIAYPTRTIHVCLLLTRMIIMALNIELTSRHVANLHFQDLSACMHIVHISTRNKTVYVILYLHVRVRIVAEIWFRWSIYELGQFLGAG